MPQMFRSMPERTGWRDEEISKRHRNFWGPGCHAIDLDFIMIEHHFGKVVALIDYKHHHAARPCENFREENKNFKACASMADKSEVPFMIVYYWPPTYAVRVYPGNTIADSYFRAPYQDLCERDFVSGLHQLREIVLTERIAANLHTELPPSDVVKVPRIGTARPVPEWRQP